MSNNCDNCAHWVIARDTHYSNGEIKHTFTMVKGKGECQKLSMVTDHDFGCNKWDRCEDDHVEITRKDGAPWQHWQMGPCPNCRARGSHGGEGIEVSRPACDRCAGTGLVRFYEDGFVGEERTRLHPNDIVKAPSCPGCKREVAAEWVHCPWCKFHLHVLEEASGPGLGSGDEIVFGAINAA